MKNNITSIVLLCSIMFSIAGWMNYAYFVYVTSVDPDLTIPQYNAKYFSGYPGWINGINESNLATIIVLCAAIILMVLFVIIKKRLKLLSVLIFVLNALVALMIGMAYM